MSDSTPWLVAEQDEAVRKHAPATERNREPIAALLGSELPAGGTILEIASGSGEHCAYFAHQFPGLVWQPSDPEPDARASIASWCAERRNVLPPLDLDVAAAEWPIDAADCMLCINMVHIAPWEATLALLDGAARILPPGAPLILYGPFLRDDVETAPSNLAFDESLRARDPAWGLRRAEDVTAEAAARGFAYSRLAEMPANNIILVYRRG